MADGQKSATPPSVNPPDIRIEDHGSVILLVPKSDAGRVWIEENISRNYGYQPYWPTVLAEHRYVTDIVLGARRDGLQVKEGY